MARRLKGVAHVLVQQSVSSNPRLRELCDSKNEYQGSVGIYFPTQTESHKRFLYNANSGSEQQFLERIVNAVILFSNSKIVDPLYTWQGVSHALLRDRLESQKKEWAAAENARREALYEVFALKEQQEDVKSKAIETAKEEANALLESFDEDIKRL